MLSRVAQIVLVGFLLGVAVASVYSISAWLLGLFVCVGMLLIMSWRRGGWWLYAFLVVMGAVIGVARVYVSSTPNTYEHRYGETMDVTGRVIADPVRTGNREELLILPEKETQVVKAVLFRNLTYARLGDRVWLRGLLSQPQNFSGFDYADYLRRQGIYAEVKRPQVVVLQRGSWSPARALAELKEVLVNRAGIRYTTPASALILGVLLGQKRDIPKESKDDFTRAGLSHIVAVSGYNMSILAGLCGGLAWYLGRRWTNAITLALVWNFVCLVGFSASVVRSAIMASLLAVAQLLGRGYNGYYLLFITAALMVMVSPELLVRDIGFQLSFSATFGVICFGRFWSERSAHHWWWGMIAPTFGAIVFTAPLIGLHFGTLSFVAPLANLFVLPLIPPLMLLGALGLLPIIGFGPAILAEKIADLILRLAQFFANQTFATISFRAPTWFYLLILGLFSVLTVLFLRSKQRLPGTKENVKI